MANVLMLLTRPFIGDTRVNREARSLTAAGHKISIFSWNRDRESDQHFETDFGSRVFMIGPNCQKRTFFIFLLKLPIFWISCLLSSRKIDFSIVHAHDLDTLPIAFLMSRIREAKLVYDAHESYSDMISDDVPSFISALTRIVERYLIRKTDSIVIAAEEIASLIGATNAIVVLNCPAKSELLIDESKSAKGGPFKLGYFGSLEPGRFLIESIDTISRRSDFLLTIGGEGTLADIIRKLAASSERIDFIGKRTHDEVMRYSAECDAMVILLDPANKNYMISTPLRLFEAMALGIPSIVTQESCSARIVLSEKCGFICDFDEGSFVELLDHIASSPVELMEMGKRGRAAFERVYNWENQALKLIQAYSEIDNRE